MRERRPDAATTARDRRRCTRRTSRAPARWRPRAARPRRSSATRCVARGLPRPGGRRPSEAKAAELGGSAAGSQGASRTRAAATSATAPRCATSSRKLSRAFAAPEPLARAALVAAELGIPALRQKAASGIARGAPLRRAHPRQPARPDLLLLARAAPREEGLPAHALLACSSRGRDRPGRAARLLQPRLRRRARGSDASRAIKELQDARRREGVPPLRDDRRRHGLRRGARRPEVPRLAREGALRRRGAYAFSALRMRSRRPDIRARITATRSAARGTMEIAFSTWASRRGVCRSWRSCGT